MGLAGGLWTLGITTVHAPSSPATIYSVDHQLTAARLPLLRWYSDEQIERVGTAVPLADGSIGLEFYVRGAKVGSDETVTLLEAGPQTLWALRSDQMEQGLQHSMQNFLAQARPALDRMLRSEAFAEDYAPAFRDIMTTSLQAAWNRPETEAATRAALERLHRIMNREVVDPGLPLLLGNIRTALKESFAATPARFLGQLLGGNLDPEIFAIALERTLEDPEMIRRLETAVETALTSRENEQMAMAFSRALLEELLARQEAIELVQRLLADPRLSDSLLELRVLGLMELRKVSQLLLGLGVTEGVHPLAALAIRAFLQLDSPYFVLLAPRPLAQRLIAGDLPAGQIMTPLERSL
ncbi:MAG TPA: hypothetical protein VK035_08760 [Kiloniellales bacterium]|nr:hypothetical protein [Kiloniellales bacterium]